jgi:hypothetical protein
MDGGVRRRGRRRSGGRDAGARAGRVPPSAPSQDSKGFRLYAEIPFYVKTGRVAIIGLTDRIRGLVLSS